MKYFISLIFFFFSFQIIGQNNLVRTCAEYYGSHNRKWINRTIKEFHYDENNRLKEIHKKGWKFLEEEWSEFWKEEGYEYHPNGEVKKYIEFTTIDGECVEDIIRDYNEFGCYISATVNYSFDEVTTSEIEFLDAENCIPEKQISWKSGVLDWKTEHFYNDSINQKVTYNFEWNEELEEWENANYEIQELHEDLNQRTISYFEWNKELGEWALIGYWVQQLNEKEEIVESWHYDSKDMLLNRGEKSYNEFGDLILQEGWRYDEDGNSIYFIGFRYNYVYDEFGKLLQRDFYIIGSHQIETLNISDRYEYYCDGTLKLEDSYYPDDFLLGEFYRIKTHYEYENLPDCHEPEELKLIVYPNPSEGYLHVESQLAKIEGTTISVFDMKGIKVFEDELKHEDCRNGYWINWLPNGTYVVQLQNSEKKLMEKLVLLK